MKISIVTLYGKFNYGNRLQNYALQSALESLGYEVFSVVVNKDTNVVKRVAKKFIEKQGNTFKIIKKIDRKRMRDFSLFDSNYTKIQIYHNKSGKIPNEAGSADIYIVGSDQVWNPLFWEDRDDAPELYNFLLTFTKKPKISYAASFGISQLSNRWRARFKPLIKDFDSISVREKDAVNIVSDLGKNATVVLDPTLLLTADRWRMIESHRVENGKDYVLLYFLGRRPDDLVFENNIDVIDLMDENSSWYTCGPDTFIELIDKASIVYTDSFHATVFSLLFHTPFVVFNREHSNKSDMSSRIRTLLDIAGIEDGLSNNRIVVNYPDDSNDKLIAIQRDKSIDFLKKSLER